MKTTIRLMLMMILATSFGCQTVRKMTGEDYMTGSIPTLGQTVEVLGVWEKETNAGPVEFTVAWRPLIYVRGSTTEVRIFQSYGMRPYLTSDHNELVGKKALVEEAEDQSGVCLRPL